MTNKIKTQVTGFSFKDILSFESKLLDQKAKKRKNSECPDFIKKDVQTFIDSTKSQ